RLYQGDYSKETVFSEDPLGVALHWQELGAPRLHVVDLDGAQQGEPVNLGVINGILALVDIPVQVGGGIRTLAVATKLLEMGASRVVLGTAAVEEPQVVEELCRQVGGDKVVVSVDARDGLVSTRGWTAKGTVHATALVKKMASLGVERFVYTDISRDGTLTEPNFAAIQELVLATRARIIASGGVASAEHVRRLAQTGVEAAIVGRALYTGALDLGAALAASVSDS
ncbi:MAG: 1-(5-phosphoribosyl)-5-[(5-phosphoribosylamino)methylideneamino]imidazole-4-carboxamide isomerase, partial [Chloroflexota bacterium]|nr:1-(5-phosphoribosyl)-5-[(5-phosphoribosylamino)methylideneamino]imidazole-4-carboxamide isomerase [Chloroflexota bacterium]